MLDYVKRWWAQVSTKVGMIVAAVSSVAPNFAQFDVRFAYAGAFAGVVMIVWPPKKSDG